ncbi:cell cycle regulator of non-homologous end joining [Mixophyes fleayi]|uniref:cell cycle regulator of non-homologous end joining n=1 Tax=Mixophyes fleayi TaxID=3061075 RepID=UPI003F4D8F3B
MDGAESMVTKRVLPQWMTDDKADTKKLCTRDVKRRKEVSPRKRIVYCMNEKELVECALEILTEDKRQRDSEKKTAAIIQGDEPGADKEREEEPQIPPEGTSSFLKIIPPLSKDLGPSTTESGTHSDQDDDPIKYVREIFFS